MIDQNAVLATLEEYADAYCAKDLQRLMAVFVDGESISLIGTGADELCSGRKAVASVFERNFRDATATQFEWQWQDVAIHKDAATVATTLNIHLEIGDEKLMVPVRWTVSLVKKGVEWKWVHRHASSAAGSQEEGSAYPVES
ncbi:nuclear transport factor 2 family protein [Aliiroseovarius sp. PrR006]|uniref:nuclear transport factor 2 family protein n=1 Tax=Aliiroseovarius sp. PrR006 TaxID=2706883 RepID=UPI0013CFE276|nr:nuclear transport factor 2 family protein [Aliiroseovarius sp. PrR006]NDW52645.1 nuclear transport factor 2 family protein [Aliiroseovarius sp. PrR006]